MRDSLLPSSPQALDVNPRPASLRIGVNLFPLALAGGGMRQYVLHLLPWMVRRSPHRFLLFHGAQAQSSVAQLLRQLHPAERNRVLPFFFEDQDQILRKAHLFDVYFCPLNCLAPDLLDRPTVATLADVQERFFPDYFTPLERRTRAEFYPHTAHAATVLLTISEFSKAQHLFRLRRAAGQGDRHAAVARRGGRSGGRAGRSAVSAGKIFFLSRESVSAQEPRPAAGRPPIAARPRRRLHVVLTGQSVQPGVDVRRETAARGLDDRVTWLGHVSPAALRRLYENAAALAFPSQFEGFGLPLVEAMACGCPIVATPIASIPEVVGDAALLVPATPAAFADALQRIVTDAGLREDLIARGRIRVAAIRRRPRGGADAVRRSTWPWRSSPVHGRAAGRRRPSPTSSGHGAAVAAWWPRWRAWPTRRPNRMRC